MRALFVIFLLYILQNIVIGDNETKFQSQINLETKEMFPKKVKVYKGLQMQLNEKYFKNYDQLAHSQPVIIHTKKHVENGYTVFPSRHDGLHKEFPDSPYFPLVGNVGGRPSSVKKVLPKYEWIRNKRSADVQVDGNEAVTKTEVEQGNQTTQKVTSDVTQKETVTSDVTQKDVIKSNVTRKNKVTKAVDEKNPVISNQTKIVPNIAAGNSSRRAIKRRSKLRSEVPNPKGGVLERKKSKNVEKPVKLAKGKRSGRLGKTKSPVNARKKNAKVKAGRRLIAARDALIEEYPYVASIQKDGEHWCSGAILNQRLVITTANCVWKASRMSRLRVRVGSRFTGRGGQVARIAEVMKHPGWSIRQKPDHDVALLSLDKNIKFSHNVHAVDLPNRVMMPSFDDAWVTSWGTERRDGVYETKELSLQVYHVRLLDKDKCNNVTQRYRVRVTENFICLAQTGRRAPCTRDTGAPAVSDGVLWGLASWGIRKLCGTERFPAMFSYIASQGNMDFITNATRFLMSDQRLSPFGDRYVYQQSPK